jgi:chromosomal replication initiation ATPase DnaA
MNLEPVLGEEALRQIREHKRRRVIARVERAVIHYRAKNSTMGTIMAEVALSHGVSGVDIKSNRRARRILFARQEFMYRAKTETLHSVAAIGRFCMKDHTTVMYGVRQYEQRMREGA